MILATSLPSRQAGLSILEMLVAMAIGLVITAAIGYLFIGSVGTFRTQDDNARLQENGRFVMDMLGRDIAQAGYTDITPVYTDPKTEFVGTPISGENGVVAARVAERKAGTDYLRLSFDGTADCVGGAVATNPVVNEYYVNAGNQLMCAGNGAGGAAQVFAEGVEDLQLIYGVDNNGDRAVDQYTATPANWGQVITAQVCLLLRSPNTGAAAQAQQYQDCAGNNQVAGDTRLRRVLRVTHQLRNRGA